MFRLMCEACLLVALSISSPMRGISEEPPGEQPKLLVPPDHLVIVIDYGGQPVLLFTEPMWTELSLLLWKDRELAMMAAAEAAVQVAVIPWMDKAERLQRSAARQWWVYGSLGAIIAIETLILILR